MLHTPVSLRPARDRLACIVGVVCAGTANRREPTDLTFAVLISLSGLTDRSPHLMDLTEEANLDRANTLPMVYSLDLRKAIAFLLELDVSRLVSVARITR